RRGMVKMVTHGDGGTQLQVNWFVPERLQSIVDASLVSSGFQNGMDVQDVTPGTGVRSFGMGNIMQQRTLAGSQQVLVDFPETGERHWFPYQHLRQVKG